MKFKLNQSIPIWIVVLALPQTFVYFVGCTLANASICTILLLFILIGDYLRTIEKKIDNLTNKNQESKEEN